MKTSVSLSTFDGPETSPMLFMKNLEHNISLISDLGYDGVDLFIIDPEEPETKKAWELLQKKNLGVGVVMPAGLAMKNLTMTDSDSEKKSEFFKRFHAIVEYASICGGMVSIGLIRGNKNAGEPLCSFLDRLAESCRHALDIAAKYGVKLVLEPINHNEIDNINSSQQALDFIKKYNLPLYLMLDTFHMNIEDDDICRSFEQCIDLVKHVHFVDSNRLAPGMGHLDMGKIYFTLEKLGYDGYLCLEALRIPDGITVARNGSAFFREIGLNKRR